MTGKYSEDLAIIIPPNDGYLDVFSEYMRYFKMNWPDCPFELILVTQEQYYEDNRVTCITTSADTQWSGRLLAGLAHTKCKYIFSSVEDGFISKRVDTDEVLRVLEFIKKHDIQYYRNPKKEVTNSKDPVFPDNSNIYKIRKNEIYGVNLGYVIWNREKLLEVFGDGKKNAWQIEEYFNEIALHSEYGYYEDMVSDKRNLLNIIETVAGGKWLRQELKMFDQLGIPVNKGNRTVQPITDVYRRRLHSLAYKVIPGRGRKKIKEFFSLLGYKFVTKN